MVIAKIIAAIVIVSQSLCAGQLRKVDIVEGTGLVLSKDTVYVNSLFGIDFTDSCFLNNMTGADLIISDIQNVSNQDMCVGEATDLISFLVSSNIGQNIIAYFSFVCSDANVQGEEFIIQAYSSVKLNSFDISYGSTLNNKFKSIQAQDTLAAKVIFHSAEFSDTLVIIGLKPIPTETINSAINYSQEAYIQQAKATAIYDIRGRMLKANITNNFKPKNVNQVLIRTVGREDNSYLFVR
jgi:hypothetical protein